MVVLVVCLVASMAIAIVRLATTPTEILGAGFHGLPAHASGPPGVSIGRVSDRAEETGRVHSHRGWNRRV